MLLDDQHELLHFSLELSSTATLARYAIVKPVLTFNRGFVPSPLAGDAEFLALLSKLDDAIAKLATAYRQDVQKGIDLECVLKIRGLYHARVDELRMAVPRLMPRIGRFLTIPAPPPPLETNEASLPFRLMQKAIDHLDTTLQLHSASLVCRSWLSYVSPRLLHRISINRTTREPPSWQNVWDHWDDRDGLDELDSPSLDEWDQYRRTAPRSWQRFLGLAYQSKRLRLHVREVVIADSSQSVPPTVTSRIIAMFPHLEELSLPANYQSTASPGMSAASVVFNGVLHLYRCSTDTLTSHILPGLSFVRHLRITQTSHKPGSQALRLPASASVSVQELTLQAIAIRSTVKALEAHIKPMALRKLTLLDVHQWDEDAGAALNSLLLRRVRSLTTLSIVTGGEIPMNGALIFEVCTAEH